MDDKTSEIVAGILGRSDQPPLNIFATFAHHPKLLRSWLPLGGRLLQGGTLDRRHTELVILRTAANVGSDYEWAQHVRISLDLDIEQEAIDRTLAGPDAPGWAPEEAALMRAVDELHRDKRIGDSTWELLAGFTDQQRIELCFLVGHYEMVAMALLTMGVELDAGLEGLPAR
jgi:alkylhydroperoxidase family enzyme